MTSISHAPESWGRRIELPTWLVAGAIYGGWAALTALYAVLPWWAVLPAGGWLLAWHGSLQHEAIHGHPTRSARLNALLAGVPLGLWLPYGIYREQHLAHHRCPELTDPHDDPESYYVAPEAWRRFSPLRRLFFLAHATLAGRLLLGPPRAVFRLGRDELARLFRGDLSHLSHWAIHLVGVALVIWWLRAVAGIPLWAYLLLLVYPGLALALLRSYAEHRAHPDRPRRTAILEAGPLFSLLFLHNNLHAVHHARPHLPWYELPAWYRANQERVLEKNGGYFIAGYLSLMRRCAIKPQQSPVYPSGARGGGAMVGSASMPAKDGRTKSTEAHYDRFYAGGGWRYSVRAQKRFLKKRLIGPLSLRPGQRVLDLGCGRGFHSHLLAQLGFDVTGVDASRAGIEAARAQYPGPRFVHLDAAKMNEHFEPETFDLIYDRGMSWYHYELGGKNKLGVDVPERTRELFTFVKTGGVFVLQIATDFSGRRPDKDIHQNRYDDYVQLFEPLGEIVLVTDWTGRELASQADAERSKKNIIIATRKTG